MKIFLCLWDFFKNFVEISIKKSAPHHCATTVESIRNLRMQLTGWERTEEEWICHSHICLYYYVHEMQKNRGYSQGGGMMILDCKSSLIIRSWTNQFYLRRNFPETNQNFFPFFKLKQTKQILINLIWKITQKIVYVIWQKIQSKICSKILCDIAVALSHEIKHFFHLH